MYNYYQSTGQSDLDGFWDDGDWVSWRDVNQYIHDQEIQEKYPHVNIEVVRIFNDIISSVKRYHMITGRYLQIWGELGELYAEIQYGLKRHKPHTAGSDGRIDKNFIEVKTISPQKGSEKVEFKTAGNFSHLIVVKISPDYTFKSRMIERSKLQINGKKKKVLWKALDLEAETTFSPNDSDIL